MSYQISNSDLLFIGVSERQKQINSYGMIKTKVKLNRLYNKYMTFFLTNKNFNGFCSGVGIMSFSYKLLVWLF